MMLVTKERMDNFPTPDPFVPPLSPPYLLVDHAGRAGEHGLLAHLA